MRAPPGAVERHRLPANRKGVHLRLTGPGAEVRRVHRGPHEQMGVAPAAFMDRCSDEDLAVIARVLGDLVRMPREGPRLRPGLLDRPPRSRRSGAFAGPRRDTLWS